MGTKEQNAERFPVRKHPRMQGYDYATPNYYFITICTDQKRYLFWTNGALNPFGQIAWDAVSRIPEIFRQNRVDSFVIMPNHIHMILVVEPGGTDVSVVIGSLKSYVTRCIRERCPKMQVWQTSFHDHVIRSWEQYQKISEYIRTNPMRWEKDCFYVE